MVITTSISQFISHLINLPGGKIEKKNPPSVKVKND